MPSKSLQTLKRSWTEHEIPRVLGDPSCFLGFKGFARGFNGIHKVFKGFTGFQTRFKKFQWVLGGFAGLSGSFRWIPGVLEVFHQNVRVVLGGLPWKKITSPYSLWRHLLKLFEIHCNYPKSPVDAFLNCLENTLKHSRRLSEASESRFQIPQCHLKSLESYSSPLKLLLNLVLRHLLNTLKRPRNAGVL